SALASFALGCLIEPVKAEDHDRPRHAWVRDTHAIERFDQRPIYVSRASPVRDEDLWRFVAPITKPREAISLRTVVMKSLEERYCLSAPAWAVNDCQSRRRLCEDRTEACTRYDQTKFCALLPRGCRQRRCLTLTAIVPVNGL